METALLVLFKVGLIVSLDNAVLKFIVNMAVFCVVLKFEHSCVDC
jgi:hypothetical protein